MKRKIGADALHASSAETAACASVVGILKALKFSAFGQQVLQPVPVYLRNLSDQRSRFNAWLLRDFSRVTAESQIW
jgi:hypothetical protein